MSGLGFFDKYGESMGFEIDGKGTFPSILGIIISLMVNSVLIGYFYKQFKVVKEYEDTSYQS